MATRAPADRRTSQGCGSTPARAQGADHRGDPRALRLPRRARRPDRGDRRRRRHQPGDRLPALHRQGGAVRAHPGRLPRRAARGDADRGRLQRRTPGPPGGRRRRLHRLRRRPPGVRRLRPVADGPAGRRAARRDLRGRAVPPRPRHHLVHDDPVRRARRGQRLRRVHDDHRPGADGQHACTRAVSALSSSPVSASSSARSAPGIPTVSEMLGRAGPPLRGLVGAGARHPRRPRAS